MERRTSYRAVGLKHSHWKDTETSVSERTGSRHEGLKQLQSNGRFKTNSDQDRREVFESQGQNCKKKPLVSVIEASRRGRTKGNLGKLNLQALLEPCRLLLSRGSFNTSKDTINKIFD